MLKRILVIPFLILSLFGFAYQEIADIQAAFLRGDYKETERLSAYLLEKGSHDFQTRHLAGYYQGVSQIQLGQFLKARASLEKVLEDSRDESLKDKASLALFDSYYSNEEYAEALKTIEKFLRKRRKTDYLSLAYLKCARAHFKLAHWEQAKKYLEKIVTQYSNSMDVKIAKQLLDEKQYFAVQVGSFLGRESAENLVMELKLKDEYGYIVETADQQNRTLYRVRVGQLASLSEAKQLKIKLAVQGYPAAQIFP